MDFRFGGKDENCVIVPVSDYNDLVRASEKIAAVERYVMATGAGGYLNTSEVMAILNIRRKENENED